MPEKPFTDLRPGDYYEGMPLALGHAFPVRVYPREVAGWLVHFHGYVMEAQGPRCVTSCPCEEGREA